MLKLLQRVCSTQQKCRCCISAAAAAVVLLLLQRMLLTQALHEQAAGLYENQGREAEGEALLRLSTCWL